MGTECQLAHPPGSAGDIIEDAIVVHAEVVSTGIAADIVAVVAAGQIADTRVGRTA